VVESSLLVRWVIKANLLAELIENPTASIEREKEMNESCPECGGKVSGCKWDKSNGIDLQTKTNHLDNYLDKNKSWNEFIEWVKIQTRDDNWNGYRDFVKIGLLIEYLKSKYFHNKDVKFCIEEFTVENLESEVKSLKPKEVQEIHIVEKVISDMWRHGDSWKDIAKKAIEIIKGNK